MSCLFFYHLHFSLYSTAFASVKEVDMEPMSNLCIQGKEAPLNCLFLGMSFLFGEKAVAFLDISRRFLDEFSPLF